MKEFEQRAKSTQNIEELQTLRKDLAAVTKEKESLYVASLQHKSIVDGLNREIEQKDANSNRS